MKKLFTTKKAGFTMIELIVVLAILGIMASLTVPSLSGFVKDAQIKDCRAKVSDIRRSYIQEAVDKGAEDPKKYESLILMDQIMKRYDGTTDSWEDPEDEEDKTGSQKKKLYSGICQNGGVYVVSFTGNSELLVSCTYEGHSDGKVDVSYVGIRTLEDEVYKEGSTIYNYFKEKGEKASLDSTGKNFAPIVQRLLQSIGIDITNTSSWRIYKLPANGSDGGETGYNIFWTEEKIDDMDFDTPINVTKYNTDTGKFYYGQAKVGKHRDYSSNGLKIINVTDVKWTEI